MAYRKRYGRKRFVRRRAKQSTWSRYGGYALKAFRMAKYVKSLINVEHKFIDTVVTANFAATATIVPLTLCAEGDDYNNRTGRSIKMSSFQCRGFCITDYSSAVPHMARLILFKDTDSRGVVPVTGDIMQTSSMNSPINLNNGKRFHVLFDKQFELTAGATSTHPVQVIKYFNKISHHITYQGTGGAQADADTGHLYLWYMTDSATTPPGLELYFRTRFVDN